MWFTSNQALWSIIAIVYVVLVFVFGVWVKNYVYKEPPHND